MSDCVGFTGEMSSADMKIKFSSNEKKRTNQEHYMVAFGSAGFHGVHDAFIVAIKENSLARPVRPPDMAGDKNGVQFFIGYSPRLLRGQLRGAEPFALVRSTKTQTTRGVSCEFELLVTNTQLIKHLIYSSRLSLLH